MWIQRWLGDAYSRLYWEFGRGSFTFDDASRVLAFKESKLHAAFSMLHGAGALIIFARERPRSYRLLDPRSLVLRMSGRVSDPGLAQEAYLQLVYDATRALRERVRIASLCVFGSVARGEAKRSSDLDVLVVSDDFQGSVASRIDALSFVDQAVGEEVAFLRGKGYTTALSLIPLRKEEAELGPAIFLDMAVNAKILVDEGGFLAGLLGRLRARLELAGARRVETEHGWYWDLKPDYRSGEEVVI